MILCLKNHPFAVEAFFEQSIVLTFSFPSSILSRFIPPCLTLDTFNHDTAFLAVAMVQTRSLRPKGFPAFLGRDFFLVGYRVFVRYKTAAGKNLRGLYILKSETDSAGMNFFGNIFTHYKYSTTDILRESNGDTLVLSSKNAGFKVALSTVDNPPLPARSPFADWKEARRFAGPLPFTFTYQAEKKQVLMIEGVRANWVPRPLVVNDWRFDYFVAVGLENPVLANAFVIENIPYYWKKGKIELWNHHEDPFRVS